MYSNNDLWSSHNSYIWKQKNYTVHNLSSIECWPITNSLRNHAISLEVKCFLHFARQYKIFFCNTFIQEKFLDTTVQGFHNIRSFCLWRKDVVSLAGKVYVSELQENHRFHANILPMSRSLTWNGGNNFSNL